MSSDTVNVRFPRRFHHEAKVGAATRSMTLQEFIEMCVREKLHTKGKGDYTEEAIEFAALDRSMQTYLMRICRALTLSSAADAKAMRASFNGVLEMIESRLRQG